MPKSRKKDKYLLAGWNIRYEAVYKRSMTMVVRVYWSETFQNYLQDILKMQIVCGKKYALSLYKFCLCFKIV